MHDDDFGPDARKQSMRDPARHLSRDGESPTG